MPTGLGPVADLERAAERSKGCLSPDDPRRPGAEEAEWTKMVADYAAWMKEQCSTKRCVSNAFAAWVAHEDDLLGDWMSLARLYAGCFVWANDGGSMLAQEPLHYWTITPVVYGKDSIIPGDNIHEVLQLTNTRTGETRILDGWTAAQQARSWLKWGARARPDEIDPNKAVRTPGELESEWGPPSQREPCMNDLSWLCDIRKCPKHGEVLR